MICGVSMKIKIQSPEQLKSEREQLIENAIDLIYRQERSCIRYCKALCTIRNKLIRINRQLGVDYE